MKALDNLVKINQLKAEAADAKEFAGMLAAAETKLKDAQLGGLSEDSQFLLVYGAAHALALAALRWHGYRSDKRYLVFQCTQHTLDIEQAKWRVLDKCHHVRNLAEYEGHMEVSPQLLIELIGICQEMLLRVKALAPIN
jgi:hypothetical protein